MDLVILGNDDLRLSIIEGKSEDIIKEGWINDLILFKELRNKYLIY